MSPADWRPGQRVKNNTIYAIICALLWLVRHLPEKAIHHLGRGLGRAGYYLDFKDRKRSLANLQLAFPHLPAAECRQLARRSFLHYGQLAADILTNPAVEISPQCQAVWQQARARGRGILVLTGHFGNWELLAQAVANFDGDFYTVAKQLYDPRLTTLVENLRCCRGLKILWRQKGHSLRQQMVALLQQGAVIAVLNDQRFKVASQMVPFFAREAKTATGAATLAWQTGATLVGAAMMRQPDQSYKLLLQELPAPAATTEEEFIYQVNLTVNHFYEQIISAYPEQWVWLHDRWRK